MDSATFVPVFSGLVYLILIVAVVAAGLGLIYFLLTGKRMKF